MSDTRGDEQDSLPASPGRRARGTGTGATRAGARNAASRSNAAGKAASRSTAAEGADAVDANAVNTDAVNTDAGNADAAARGRGPGRPARRAEAAGRTPARHRIGIRELRQDASTYVNLAERGYTVDITNRGRLVAQLVPVSEPGSPLERLIAAGIVEPAEEPGGAGGLEPYPPSGPGGLR
jgi:prevent-host-death family protein